MSVVVVGSVALDSVETPFGKKDNLLGGSATYFSFGARFFTNVGMVATVGEDFPVKYEKLFHTNNIDTEGLKREKGKTFRWKGKYSYDLNNRTTVFTHLNVFRDFSPQIPLKYKNDKFLFLANVDPDLQERVLSQAKGAKFIACDTMNYWIEHKSASLLRLLKKVDALFINDSEARELTGETNLIKASQWILGRGIKMAIIKKGEHGCIFATKGSLFTSPAYPLAWVYDPTGAGDTFAGGFLGYLSTTRRIGESSLRKAIAYGTVMASFTVESFGPERLIGLTKDEISSRYREFQKLTRF